MTDTIFALSRGAPPAAIAVVRVSGPRSGDAMRRLLGRALPPRRAVAGALRDPSGELIDRVLALWLPGPNNATGEDTLELHCHGGRAVVRAVEQALAVLPGLRAAQPGEFTRRAFANGRIDLAEAEGLADLLAAETELQRSAALAMAGGDFSRRVEGWRQELLRLSAQVEAVLDFGDEDDVGGLPGTFAADLASAVIDHQAVDLVGDILEGVGDPFEMLVDLARDHEGQRIGFLFLRLEGGLHPGIV